MTTFARTILPASLSYPAHPTGLVSAGDSGKQHVRAFARVGRTWTESYGVIPLTAANYGWLTVLHTYFAAQTIFDIDHRLQRTILGSGGATTPQVSGSGSQTGTSITTSTWGAGAAVVLKAGDVIKFAALNLVYDITADVTTDGAAAATITIYPPIYPGGSPAYASEITTNKVAGSVLYRARIADLQMPRGFPVAAGSAIDGMTITFQECP